MCRISTRLPSTVAIENPTGSTGFVATGSRTVEGRGPSCCIACPFPCLSLVDVRVVSPSFVEGEAESIGEWEIGGSRKYD
jgi:hypothetical protein